MGTADRRQPPVSSAGGHDEKFSTPAGVYPGLFLGSKSLSKISAASDRRPEPYPDKKRPAPVGKLEGDEIYCR